LSSSDAVRPTIADSRGDGVMAFMP
jgi:hypothetical protein